MLGITAVMVCSLVANWVLLYLLDRLDRKLSKSEREREKYMFESDFYKGECNRLRRSSQEKSSEDDWTDKLDIN